MCTICRCNILLLVIDTVFRASLNYDKSEVSYPVYKEPFMTPRRI